MIIAVTSWSTMCCDQHLSPPSLLSIIVPVFKKRLKLGGLFEREFDVF